MLEAMTVTTRAEYDRVPAKYQAIALTIGADRMSREHERDLFIARVFGAT